MQVTSQEAIAPNSAKKGCKMASTSSSAPLFSLPVQPTEDSKIEVGWDRRYKIGN